MGRRKTIDREVLLDAAEQIITIHGAAALTIDAVAKAVGITKGGVQYSFSSKDALIEAMFDRWGASYDKQFHKIAGDNPDPQIAVRAHIEATKCSDEASTAKAAGLLAALIQTPEHLESTRIWYRQRFAGLDMTTEEGRQARLAFLATEGAFILRFFGLMDISPEEWRDMFDDILATMPPDDISSDASTHAE
ncbi:TetR/AcrR family transcriptional regulator [Xenorhabdus szentirmaii]|uniref:TetR/AcrR family transcriptional regulator n=1 Tax=Xenorhabdus szentirmaii TaxID=290112 RepID=UPI0019846D50|nr:MULTISPECIES: TetR/AcrR family transcriptional regulator [unclassified Xenorhabdus]MBD2780303.1 TetR/AcrR family transcriptional regulator [Xenorhabdus sp. 38]MBD2790721.1 TetR/AcrR family transcriptional regulator [Xenorhabdus sp. CUL]MBD2804856.1 TetR/AcrR family transcriptional regulator [Xenorhabdus sp. ZM]